MKRLWAACRLIRRHRTYLTVTLGGANVLAVGWLCGPCRQAWIDSRPEGRGTH